MPPQPRPRARPALPRASAVLAAAAASCLWHRGALEAALCGPNPRGSTARRVAAGAQAASVELPTSTKRYRKALLGVASALGIQSEAESLGPQELAEAIGGKIQALKTELSWQELEATEAEGRLEACYVDSLMETAASDEEKGALRKSAEKAQARAFTADMKSALPDETVPFSRLNSTLQLLNQTQIDCEKASEERLAAEERAAQLAAELSEARERVDLLLEGLRDIGKSVGVGGIGGVMMLVTGDEDLISETRDKVQSLQNRK